MRDRLLGLFFPLRGLGSSHFCLQLSHGFGDPLQPAGAPLQFLWQLVTPLALAVFAVT